MNRALANHLLSKPRIYLWVWSFIQANANNGGVFTTTSDALLLEFKSFKLTPTTLRRILKTFDENKKLSEKVARKWRGNSLYFKFLDGVSGAEVARNEMDEVIADVIKYLNTKAEKRFSLNAEPTIKSIRARLRDGYSFSDITKVIDIKVSQWKGTELDKYLRPKTLFNPGNFQSYINENPNYDGIQQTSKSRGDSTLEIFQELDEQTNDSPFAG